MPASPTVAIAGIARHACAGVQGRCPEAVLYGRVGLIDDPPGYDLVIEVELVEASS